MHSVTRMSRTCGNVSNPGYIVYSIYATTASLLSQRDNACLCYDDINSVTKGSYSITGKACNLILFTELHFTKLRGVFVDSTMDMIFHFWMEYLFVTLVTLSHINCSSAGLMANHFWIWLALPSCATVAI
jgi:hypothetical protein